MCKPRINRSNKHTCSSGPVSVRVREHLKEHLRSQGFRPQPPYQQFPKVGRKNWFEVLLYKIDRLFGGR